jgi:hypothetical protein
MVTACGLVSLWVAVAGTARGEEDFSALVARLQKEKPTFAKRQPAGV